jgi:hypothetical protein
MISKSTWGWIFTAVFFFSYLIVLSMLIGEETRVKKMNQTIDSLEAEIEVRENQLRAREEEISILMQLNVDDFDRAEDIENIERLFSE